MSNSNIGPYKTPLRDISLNNLGDVDFDVSRLLKVKFNGAFDSPYMTSY